MTTQHARESRAIPEAFIDARGNLDLPCNYDRINRDSTAVELANQLTHHARMVAHIGMPHRAASLEVGRPFGYAYYVYYVDMMGTHTGPIVERPFDSARDLARGLSIASESVASVIDWDRRAIRVPYEVAEWAGVAALACHFGLDAAPGTAWRYDMIANAVALAGRGVPADSQHAGDICAAWCAPKTRITRHAYELAMHAIDAWWNAAGGE